MDDNSVSVERVRFGDYETEVEDILERYHESVARGFREFVARVEADYEFSSESYVDGEMEKDVSYLATSDSKRLVVVALDEARVVGCVYLYDLSAEEGEVKRLFVSNEYRGLGLGRRLMETLIEYAERGEYSTLWLDTAPFMNSARRLYEELGFEPYDGGESISDIPAPILDDITYMKLRLDDGQ